MAKRSEASTASRVRAPLSRERVLHAAIALADDGGLEALSMRRLGQELGVEAMSLYNHVANKDDLLDGMLELVLGEVELPAAVNDDWQTAVRASAVSAHDALRRHRWACSLAMSPPRILPIRIRYMEWLLATLRESGFSAALTYHAYHALDAHLWGYTLWELGHTITKEEIGDLAADFLRRFPADAYPYLHEHVEQHVGGLGGEATSGFEFVLDLMLESLERARASD